MSLWKEIEMLQAEVSMRKRLEREAFKYAYWSSPGNESKSDSDEQAQWEKYNG